MKNLEDTLNRANQLIDVNKQLQSFGTLTTTLHYICKLAGKYSVFAMAMEIYHYSEIIGSFSLLPILHITYMIIKRYYPGEPLHIHIQSLISIV